MGLTAAGTYPPVTWAEINLSALAHNFRELRRLASSDAEMMAAVKGDGYGHGAVEVSRVALENGARFLAVARFDEAVQLRDAGIDAPILIFGHSLPRHLLYIAENDIRLSLNSFTEAELISREAVRAGKTVKAHIKADTGMGRLGIPSDGLPLSSAKEDNCASAARQVLAISELPGIEVEGIFTHFACADCSDKSSAKTQIKLFKELLDDIHSRGLTIPIRHAANSAATIELPESHLDMVRPGISLYGLWPSDEVDKSLIDLKPAMTVKSTVIQVKEVDAGFAVSYGSTHVTPKPTIIATVPIGYADGYDRVLSSKGSMLVRGVRAPIVGRVCMDLTMIDVGHIPGVSLEDEVVVLGKQGSEEITADEIAGIVGTINYEIVSSLTSRVTRVYRP
ncbi:MAG: alanine racemase [bacterium]|nr:alanine racemase [bacterium]